MRLTNEFTQGPRQESSNLLTHFMQSGTKFLSVVYNYLI